jgi:hypothetical protein
MHIGVMKDEEEAPCAEGPVRQIRAAATALGRLWILDSDGKLSSFDRALEHKQSHLADKVVDVIRRAEDGSLWAVVNEANRWRVLRRDASGWHHLADLPAGLWNDDALAERGGRPVLATRDRTTIWFDAAGLLHLWEDPRLNPWQVGRTSAVTTSDGSIHVGRDAGEFGGSLESIHVGSPGRPWTSQKEVFRGPTTDVVVDPTDRRCVIASQALVDFDGSGRIVRACPGEVSIILQVPDAAEWETGPLHEGRRQKVPFYKLIANGPTVYAVGKEETFAINGRATRRLPPPTFAERCGLTVAHLEGVMFVRLPWMAKQFPRDSIGVSRFAVPAL